MVIAAPVVEAKPAPVVLPRTDDVALGKGGTGDTLGTSGRLGTLGKEGPLAERGSPDHATTAVVTEGGGSGDGPNHPLVKCAMELFGARVVDIQPRRLG